MLFARSADSASNQFLTDSTAFHISRSQGSAMENDKRNDQHQESRSSFAAEVAHKAEDRLEDTTQEYLDKAGVGLDARKIVSLIRDQPLKCAGAVAAAGFVVGGGLSGALGLAVLGFLARTAVRATVYDLLAVARNQRNQRSTGAAGDFAENI
jgi:hypothetical protein